MWSDLGGFIFLDTEMGWFHCSTTADRGRGTVVMFGGGKAGVT
jgi:hypothetical protein